MILQTLLHAENCCCNNTSSARGPRGQPAQLLILTTDTWRKNSLPEALLDPEYLWFKTVIVCTILFLYLSMVSERCKEVN